MSSIPPAGRPAAVPAYRAPDTNRAHITTLALGYVHPSHDRDRDGAIGIASESLTYLDDQGTGLGRRLSDSTDLTILADNLGNRDGRATFFEYAAALGAFDNGGPGAVAGDGYLDGRELLIVDRAGLWPTVRRLDPVVPEEPMGATRWASPPPEGR